MGYQKGMVRPPEWLTKGAAVSLLFSFIFPLTSLAQTSTTAPTDTPPTIVSTQESAGPVVVEEEPPTTDVESTPVTDTQTKIAPVETYTATPSSDTESAELKRKTVDPKFYKEPDPVTGSLSYSYPITIPPGRNGMQPDLRLSYSSQPGEDVNTIGYGWDTSIPYIQRLNKNGIDKLYTQDYFVSSLDGEILPITASSTTYGAKVDSGSFNQYQYASSTYWVLTDKLGTTYTFGTTSAARQDDPNNSSHVYRWMLQQVKDTNGNAVTYSYVKDQGQIYPYKITYTSNGTSAAPFEIEFLRENRTDIATTTKAGFPIVSSQRINEIQAKVNGAWVRDYVLAYSTGNNGYRSLLHTVTESGKDSLGATTTRPAITFDYQQALPKGWGSVPGVTVPISFNGGTYFSDINSDGLTDLVYSYNTSATTSNLTYLSTGSGWTASSTWVLPTYLLTDSAGGVREQARLADVNGDGRTDVVVAFEHSYPGTEGASVAQTYMNTGSGWTASTTWNLPVYFSNTGSISDYGVRLADVNGDGLVDVMKSYSATSTVYLNNGAGWTLSTTTIPVDLDKKVRLEDVNGDGLIDLLQSYAGTRTTYLNTGSGWTSAPAWAAPADFADSDSSDRGVRFADVNGDGLIDVLHSYNNLNESANKVYLNTGSGWATNDPQWQVSEPFTSTSIPVNGDDTVDAGLRIADVNGDGQPDLIQGLVASTSALYLNNSKLADLLSQVTYPEGGTAAFTYKASKAYKDGSGVLLNPTLPLAINTLQSVTVDDGFGTSVATSFTYEGGKYYFLNPFDRKFAGFQKMTKTDGLGAVTKTFYHQGDTSDTSRGEYADDVSKIGRAYRTETTDSSGNLFAKNVSKWDTTSLGNGRSFISLIQQTDFTYDGNSDHREKASTFNYSTTTGNVVMQKNWGEVSGSDDGSFTDTGNDAITTGFAYAASSTGYILGLVSQATTTDQTGTKIGERRLYYDSTALNSVLIGNQTKEERWITGSTYASTTRTYTAYGLPLKDTNERNYYKQYTYDTNNLYPTTVKDEYFRNTKYAYDYATGKVSSTTDINGASFVTVLDGLGRIKSIQQPNTATTSALIETVQYQYIDTAFPSVHETRLLSTATSTDNYYYFDGLGRILQTRTEAEKNGDFVTQDFKYGTNGQVQKQSLPYFSNGSDKTNRTAKSALYTTYTYDVLGRVLTAVNAVGTTATSYSDWKVTVTDANGHPKDLTYDALGRLVKVSEHNGASTYDTQYGYDGNGNLASTTDASGNMRLFTYDALGRLLTSQDLHAPSDTTFGTTTYTYDLVGNLTRVVDPKSQTINYNYDELNRMTREDYTGSDGYERTFTYDNCTFGLGRMCTGVTSAATVSYTYNSMGRVATQTEAISGVNYPLTTTYDWAGNPLSITYPDTSVVYYLYNSAGQLESIEQQENATTTRSKIITTLDYGPTGAITYQKNGNQTETFNTFDATAVYRLTDRKTIGPGNPGGLMQLARMQALQAAKSAAMQNTDTVKSVQDTPVLQARFPLHPQSAKFNDVVNTSETDTGNGGKTVTTPAYTLSLDQDPYGKVFGFTSKDTALTISLPDAQKDVAVHRAVAQQTTLGAAYTYPNALGAGTDLEIVAGDDFVQKNIVLNTKPQGTKDYEVTFKLATADPSSLDVIVDGKHLRWSQLLTSTNKAEILSNGKTIGYIYPPVATDSSEKFNPAHQIAVAIRYELKSDGIYLTKIIPAKWLASATYPVRADFTFSTFSGTGDGGVSPSQYPGDWAEQHADTIGSGAHYTDSTFGVGVASYYTPTGYQGLERAFIPVDTSSLPDNATVGSTTLYMKASERLNDYDDSYAYLTVYQSTQASPTAVIAADIDNCGDAETNPTKGSEDVRVASTTVGSYKGFHLNSTGQSWISKTGYSMLCMREGHDATNTQVINNHHDPWYWMVEKVSFYSADTTGSSSDPYLVVEYTLPSTTPTVATNLFTEGQTNPVNMVYPAPIFSAQFNDSAADNTANYYQLQVSSSTAFTTNVWDSGKTALSPLATTSASVDIAYGGTALPLDATTYYWRIKFWNNYDNPGPWTSATSTYFTMADDGSLLQKIHYTYDAVGNITQISDTASLNDSRTVTYTYDDLNRLLSSFATTTDQQTMTYDPLGNLLTKSDQGTYAYVGNTGSNYSNPHALTSLGTGLATSTFAYDRNGNVTSITAATTTTYTWDYLNHLTIAKNNLSTSTYSYDALGSRVKYTLASSTSLTTYYPNRFYTISGPTIERDVYLGDQLIASIGNAGGATTTMWVHPDHLGSTNVLSGVTGTSTERITYHPYGAVRSDASTSSFTESRKYIGQEYDRAPQLSYLNARYYNSSQGQFLSQDPVFLEDPRRQNLVDPQSLNSYSYANDNPVVNKDPSGRCVWDLCIGEAVLVGLAFYGGYTAGTDLYQGYTSGNNNQLAMGVVGAGISLIPGVSAEKGAVAVAENAAKYSIYVGRDAEGLIRYVGITSRDVAKRIAEHRAAIGTGREALDYSVAAKGLLKNQARLGEQSIIDRFGLSKNGGQLYNKINSVSTAKADTIGSQLTASGRAKLSSLLTQLSKLVSQLTRR